MKSLMCERVQAELLDYLEQEMPAGEARQVRNHLADCEICYKEYKGLQVMLNKAKNLAIEDPGEEFWQQLPQKVLAQVKKQQRQTKTQVTPQATSNSPQNNIIDFSNKRQSLTAANLSPKSPRLNYHTDFKTHRLTAALALAASLLLLINVMTFSPKDNWLWFDQGRFQAQIQTKNFPLLTQSAARSSALGAPARLGFVDQRPATAGFMAGTQLAESFAYLHGGQYPLAVAQLENLQQQLQQQSVSAVTLSSLRKAEETLQSGKFKPNQISRLLNTFQHDYENFLTHTAPQQLILYRAGIWVFNANLAVAAKDAAAVNQLANAAQLDYLQNAFSRINAPPGVRNTLLDIGAITQRLSNQSTSLSDGDYHKLQRALRNLYALLG